MPAIIYNTALLAWFICTLAGCYSAGQEDWPKFAGCALVSFSAASYILICNLAYLGGTVEYIEEEEE